MKNKLMILMAGLVLMVFSFSSCDDEIDYGTPDRLFRPIIKSTSKGGTWIRIEWDNFKDVVSYELEVSLDSFETVVLDTSVTTNIVQINNLEYDTRYQIRLKSVGDTLKSEWYVAEDITTDDYPTLLLTPVTADLLDKSVRVRWKASEAVYDRIIVFKENEAVDTIAISDRERTLCTKIVSGLKESSTYIFKVFDAQGNYFGKKSYKTVASQDFGLNVVDLRGLDEVTALGYINQTFVDTICTNYDSQKVTLVLDGGVCYKIPTLLISKNVDLVITTGLSFAGNAVLNVNSGFGIAASSTVNSITLSNLIITEGTDAGKKKTDANYGGTYLFNFNQSGGNLNALNLSKCDIRYKRGIVRLQTTATLGSVAIENCLMDSIGGYGIVNIDNAASTVNDILIKNSTIAHADKILVGSKPTVSPNSVTMENITTYYAPGSNIYIADFNGKAVGSITFKKCLFGPGKAAAGINGVRSSTTSLSVTDCLKSSDLIWYTADGAAAPVSPLNDVVDCGVTSSVLFASPDNVNFKVTSSAVVNKVGDPRWW